MLSPLKLSAQVALAADPSASNVIVQARAYAPHVGPYVLQPDQLLLSFALLLPPLLSVQVVLAATPLHVASDIFN